jgi:hypothetical protein
LVGVRIASTKTTVPDAGAKEPPMTKRAERAEGTQAENGAGPELAYLVEPMLAGMTTTRHHLLAWVHAHGLAALDEVFRAEAVALAGPKGRHQVPRTHHHWGTTATELTFGGRRLHVVPAPGAADDRRGSDLALGGGVSGPGPADRADDAAAPRRGVDAPLRGQSRGATARPAHPEQ